MSTLYPLIMGREAVVSTEHYLSAAAGARIFDRGGNAIDAAVAAGLVEGVVNPHMHTIGGEAPMLIRLGSNQRIFSINGNTMAPARGHDRSLSGFGPGSGSGRRIARRGSACGFRRVCLRARKLRHQIAGRGRRPRARAMRRRLHHASGAVRRRRFDRRSGPRHGIDSCQRRDVSHAMAVDRAHLHARRRTSALRRHHQESSAGEFFPSPARCRSGARKAAAKPDCKPRSSAFTAATSRARSSRTPTRTAGCWRSRISQRSRPGSKSRRAAPSRRDRLQVRTVVARAGISATTRAARGLRSRRNGA